MFKKSQKIFSIIMILALCLTIFGEGGSAKSVYAAEPIVLWNEITNRTQLENIAYNLSGNYRLMADIDLAGGDWIPLGSATTPFTGKFDGNSRVIRNLTITDTTKTNQGLFSFVGSGGEIAGLGIEGVNITAANNTGILAGTNNGIISRCYTKGSVSGFEYVGGLVGQNSGTIQNSYTQATVSSKNYLGGLAGTNTGTVQNSYAASPLYSSVFNNYLEFNGTPVGDYSSPNSGGYIDIAHKDNYVQNQFTLEAWFQWDGVGTNDCNFIIGKGYEQFEIHTGGGSGINGLRFIPIWNNSGDSWIDVKNVIQPGWFHVAAVYDYDSILKKAYARVYINGVAQELWRGTTPLGKTATLDREFNTLGYNKVNGILVPEQNNINIGRRTDGWFYFDGRISDVRFWNIARTGEDIKRDKDKVLTGTEPGLVGYWKLNEASGAAIDSTANLNHGTLTGDVTRIQETAAAYKGGLIGYNSGLVTSSFYDSELTGLTDDSSGIHKSTAEMKIMETFTNAGWDFATIWGKDTSYPFIKEQTYNVTFESNGGSTVDSLQGEKYQELLPSPSDPTKTNYSFNGWYKDAALTSLWNFTLDTMPAKDITLYAKWTGDSYTVTYDAEGGSVTPGSQTKMYGSTYGKGSDGISAEVMPTPYRTGYTFLGWYDGDNGTGNLISDASAMLTTGNHTLYAKWMANTNTAYKVEHYQQTVDGTGYTLAETDNLTGTTDESATAVAKSYTGFTENTSHTDRVTSGIIAGDGSLMLKLYYDRKPYTVTFKDWDETELKTQSVLYGGNVTAPSDPVRTGYTFTGWSGAFSNVTGNLTVTALYTANTNTAYKVAHYKQTVDGTGYTLTDTDSLTGTTDGSATAVAKSYTGFIEKTNHPDRVANGTIIWDGSLVLKLYYDRIPYTVTFKDWNGTEIKAQSVLYSGNAAAPSDPVRTGYTFTGWLGVFSNVTENLTITAQYTSNTNTSYNVEHYQQNVDGTGYTLADTDSLTGTTDGNATATAKSYTGFIENTNHNGRITTGTIAGDGSLVLKLYYDRISYTVTFKDWNGTELKAQSVLYGGNAAAPSDPVRTGYTFAGWSDAFNNVTENLTVTAQYTANTNTVYKVEHYQQTVDGTGYTLAETDNLTGTTDVSATAVTKTYTGFIENTNHNGRITTGTIAGDGSLVLKLYYNRIPYTVIFKDWNGTELKTQSVLYGGGATAPSDPVRTGYTFAGWSDAFNNVNGNLTVTVQYSANTSTAYKVEHYKQTVDGTGYTLADTENLFGTTDISTTATAKSYTGFKEKTNHPDRVKTGTIVGDGSLVLKLYYDRVPYTVIFKDWIGTELKTQSVLYGGSATAPMSPVRAGYTFTGWSGTFNNVIENLTISAQYSANTNTAYKVEHYQQTLDGTGYALADTEYLFGTTDISATAVAKSYIGFTENTNHNGRVPTGIIAGDGSLVLKLYYNRIPYTVTFKDWNGTELKSQSVLYGGSATAPSDPVRTGYTFTGWSGTFNNVTENLTVTAQYSANTDTAYKVEHYKQTVDGKDYTLADTDSLSGTTDGNATGTAKIYNGFTEKTNHPDNVKTGIIAGDGSLVLKLYYDRIPYTVTFKDWNGTEFKSQSVLYGGSATAPSDPVRTGYTLTGWSGTFNNVTENLTVSAQYSANTDTAYKVDHYQQTVDGTGYTLADTDNLTGTTDESAIAVAKNYTGFTEKTNHPDSVKTGTIAGDGRLVLKLYYDRIPYTVTFKDWNGTEFKTQSVLFGSNAAAPSDPVRTGYTFAGWSDAFNNVNGNLTVTAQYTANTNTAYVVEHYQQTVEGTGYTLADADNLTGITDESAIAVAKGYAGFTEKADYPDSVKTGTIAGDGSLVLKLYYDRIPYTVTFKDWNGTELKAQSVLYGGNAAAPSDPVRAGYTFTGWSGTFNNITENLTISAQYSANTNTAYKVEHYQQTVDGTGYTLADTDSLTGTTNESAIAVVKSYTGFTEKTNHSDRVKTGTIVGDGSLVLKLYYDRVVIKRIDDQTLISKTVGYGAGSQEIKSVTITKAGTGDIANITVSISGGANSNFVISQPVLTTLDETRESTLFTIKAKDGLAVGIYTETVTISADSMADMAFTITQTVNEAPVYKPDSVEVIVNGRRYEAATAETKKIDDTTITTITLDDKKIMERLDKEGEAATIAIPVNNSSDIVVGELTGQTVKNMEKKEAVLEIKTENITYTLPASQINIDDVSTKLGKEQNLKDIKVNITVAASPQDTIKIVEDTANKNNYQVVVKPIEFTITCNTAEKSVEVSKFNGYVERMVGIPLGIDPSKITTGIVLNNDGTFSHVPTTIVVIDGKYYAKINSITNSTYSVIWSPKAFSDVENHWAKEAVNDMASRLVIEGVGDGSFKPDREITRAEFAVIMVKALGLMRPGYGRDIFSDVNKGAWYYDAVTIAYDYGILSGYGNGKYGSSDKITREQAMTIVAKAMKVTGLNVEFQTDEAENLLKEFSDLGKSADWARNSMSACVKTGIVTGKSEKMIAPKDEITRAEVAVIIRKLLQKSGLI